MPSIKDNIILNGIKTITELLFPVVTFPYAARVLMPDGIGAVNFQNSIISYIVLLTNLGIPMYAVKEVAKYRDDKKQRDKITIEIIILSTTLCLFGYIAVWALAEFVPQINRQATLFYTLSLSVILSSIGVNWFYNAIEDFKFITIRAIIIRTFAAAALFIFVKDSSDLLIYGIIIVGSSVGNNLINFVHLRKHISLKPLRINELNLFRHLKPAFRVFMLNLIISLYLQLNSIMIGFMSGDDAVGYYTAGTKISHIGLTLIGSLGTVLLPRCSHLIKSGQMETFESIIKKSLNVTLALSIPMTVGLMVLAAPLTIVLCGIEFMDSIPVLYLNAPVIIFISLTNVMGIQILYPMDKIKLVIYSVSGGAITNLILNFVLIPSFGATGAALSTLVAELTVLIIQLVSGKSYYPFKTHDILSLRYLIGSLIMGIASYTSTLTVSTNLSKLIMGACVGFAVYSIFLILIKDSLMMEMKTIVLKKLGYAK